MNSPARMSGVLVPVVTPFGRELSPNAAQLIRQCRWLLSHNVGLAVFGTNSEANSLSVDEKIMLLDELVAAGIDVSRLMPGTGCCALSDTIRLTAHAVKLGCAGTLMLPPFYYKDVSDEGLYRSYSEVIERVADERMRIYLYHIPPIAQVGISIELVDRLVKAYPQTIAGIKDSSGDWDNTSALLERQWDNFQVFAGSESFLLQNMQGGGAGCISATANINPAAIYRLYAGWQSAAAATMQQELDEIRELLQRYPMISALKAVIAFYSAEPGWDRLRPPLEELPEEQKLSLMKQLHIRGFTMPGLREATAA